MNWYSVFIRSYADSNNDGIGDLNGLTNKLDYLKDLGIEGIWLSPIHPSVSYHKYDITDYYSIDKEYGTLADFTNLIQEAHKRKIKIIIDFVVNHTSDNHPWFISSMDSKTNSHRKWYEWKPAILRTKNEINFWHYPDYGPQDEVYFGLFWKGMPDLNFDHIPVRTAIKNVAKFWIEQGVDGFRLDAAMHIYPPFRENENHKWWKEFSEFAKENKKDCTLIGEVTHSCSFIEPYLSSGIDACFNFELSDKIIELVINQKQDFFVDWLMQIKANYTKISPYFMDAIFLSNHDQTRIATRLQNPEKTKLAASILITLPGDPFIYYGEEIGMFGDKPDEFIREPFLWDVTTMDKERTYNVAAKYNNDKITLPYFQQKTIANSIFNHYKELLNLRKQIPALNKGDIKSIHCSEKDVLIFSRVYKDQHILIAHNLTDQTVQLCNEDENPGNFQLFYSSRDGVQLNKCHFELPAYCSIMAWYKE